MNYELISSFIILGLLCWVFIAFIKYLLVPITFNRVERMERVVEEAKSAIEEYYDNLNKPNHVQVNNPEVKHFRR